MELRMTLGIILILIGLSMAWSGFSVKWKYKQYINTLEKITRENPALLRHTRLEIPREYGYHSLFRQTWWIPTVIGFVTEFLL
jgi:hypothetical protein